MGVPRIVLLAGTVGALVAGCGQTTTGSASPAAVTTAVATNTPVVQVPGVGEGASYDQAGHITFWRSSNGAWQQIGASTYPLQPALGPVEPKVTGAALTGMSHAVFILTGTFSMDHSINAIAYTANAAGEWGAIKAEANGNIGPSGQPVGSNGIGLSNAFYAVGGELETADCSGNLPMADCGGNQRILKFWKWNGSDFTLSRTAGLTH